jgi:hypothetical protein
LVRLLDARLDRLASTIHKHKQKNPRMAGFCHDSAERLLDFAFFVDDVPPYYRVKLLDLHFARLIALVLGRRIEMSGSGS